MLNVERKDKEKLLRAFIYNRIEFEHICEKTVSLRNKTIEQLMEAIGNFLEIGTYGLTPSEIMFIRTELNSYASLQKTSSLRDKIMKNDKEILKCNFQLNILFRLLEDMKLTFLDEEEQILIVNLEELRKLRLEELEKQLLLIRKRLEELEHSNDCQESTNIEELDQQKRHQSTVEGRLRSVGENLKGKDYKDNCLKTVTIDELEKESSREILKNSQNAIEKRLHQLTVKFSVPADKEIETIWRNKFSDDDSILQTILEQKHKMETKINLVNYKLFKYNIVDEEEKEALLIEDRTKIIEWAKSLLKALPTDSTLKQEFLISLETDISYKLEELYFKKVIYLEEEYEFFQKLALQKNAALQSDLHKKYKFIRQGQLNPEQKIQYQNLIELYLTGLLTKTQLQKYCCNEKEYNNQFVLSNIKCMLENESYITEVFGEQIWKKMMEHEQYLSNLAQPPIGYHLLTDPQLRKYVPRDYIYVTKEENIKLKELDCYMEILQKNPQDAEAMRTENVEQMIQKFHIDTKLETIKRNKTIKFIADYKILYEAGNEKISENFSIPLGSVHYFLNVELSKISPAKYFIAKSISDRKYFVKGLTDEQKELAKMVYDLKVRGYDNEQVAFLINTSVEDVEYREKQYKRIKNKRKNTN